MKNHLSLDKIRQPLLESYKNKLPLPKEIVDNTPQGYNNTEKFTKENKVEEYKTDELGNILGIDIDESNKITKNDSLSVIKLKLEVQRQIAANSAPVSNITTVEDVPVEQPKEKEKIINGFNFPDYSVEAGNKLANEASKVQNTVSGGRCLAGVADILDAVYPEKVPGIYSAYQMKDVLELDYGIGSHFTRVNVAKTDLSKLPAGAVVVWNNNLESGGSNVSPNGQVHGHVSIADGRGYEISDFRTPQIDNRDAQFAVFIPIS